MKTERKLICISCPMGCQMNVMLEDSKVVSVEGNSCRLGITYAEKECTSPARVVTTTLPLNDGNIRVVPVKTAGDIPKDKIFECIKALSYISVDAPVKAGDIVARDIAGTGVDIVAARTIDKV